MLIMRRHSHDEGPFLRFFLIQIFGLRLELQLRRHRDSPG